MTTEPVPDPSAARLVGRLVEAGLTIGTAESLTGGLLGATLTSVPGASATYVGSVVSYATRVKADLLGVDRGRLAAYGAVDPVVALEMARGVCQVLGCDLGLGTTGVAGPDPADGAAVGTAFVAVAWPAQGIEEVVELSLDGGREDIRAGCVRAALELALRYVESSA